MGAYACPLVAEGFPVLGIYHYRAYLVGSWVLALVVIALAAWVKRAALLREHELKTEIQVKERSRLDERAGRVRLEKEIRRRVEGDLSTSTQGGTFVHPIGTIRSCFKCCVGTPRQGLLAPSARASLVLESSISPASLDNLHEFSHVWITFIFHLNTNTNRNFRALAKSSPGQPAHTFPAKITPPMLKRRVGIFSTRTPHRPNPIGVTLARIARVDPSARTVHLCAVDLVDGTPVLDLKPFVPMYDTVPHDGWTVPQWIHEGIGSRRSVIIPPEVSASLEDGQLRLYKGEGEAFLALVQDVLAVDVRSVHQDEGGRPATIRLDTMVVEYRIEPSNAGAAVEGGDGAMVVVRVVALRRWRRTKDGEDGGEEEGGEGGQQQGSTVIEGQVDEEGEPESLAAGNAGERPKK